MSGSVVAQSCGYGGRGRGVSANGYEVSFGGGENILKLDCHVDCTMQ